MAMIGNFGGTIVFETSSGKIINFKNFNRTVSASWETHQRIGKKPLSEFMGPELSEVTLDITLNAMHGVKPRTMIESIEYAIEVGQIEYLVIGNRKVGSEKWKIKSMSEAWDTVLEGGELMRATLSLTLEEYL